MEYLILKILWTSLRDLKLHHVFHSLFVDICIGGAGGRGDFGIVVG